MLNLHLRYPLLCMSETKIISTNRVAPESVLHSADLLHFSANTIFTPFSCLIYMVIF